MFSVDLLGKCGYNEIDLIGKHIDEQEERKLTTLLELDAQRRDAILNAALKEFAVRGYDNASTNVIAKEAGISKALMFHYVSSKQELFLVVYDFFSDLMKQEYFELMNYEERDIFNKLHQSYVLQIALIQKYPWITEFSKL